jgi:predicted secreted protein
MSNIVRLAKEFVIKYRGTIVARCRDFSITVGKNTVDITSFDSDGWEEFVGDLKNWSINFSAMVTRGTAGSTTFGTGTFDSMFDFMATDTDGSNYGATVILGDASTGYMASASYFSGLGILSNLSADGAVGDVISYSGEIQGAGKLTRKSTV